MRRYIDFYENKFYDYSSIDTQRMVGPQDPFEFFLLFRLNLERLNPPDKQKTGVVSDHDGRQVPILRWDDDAWLHFTRKYVKSVMDVWDKAFLLIPPAKYDGFVYPPGPRGTPRKLLCRLDIQLWGTQVDAQASVRVVRMANPAKDIFRADAGLYDVGIADPEWQSFWPAHTRFQYNRAAHEFGHLLGFWHVNQADERCDVGGETSICYGSNLEQRMNVMGGGSMLDLDNALPWLKRVEKHAPPTLRSQWKTDWASSEAALRGTWPIQIDEKYKVKTNRPKPGIIDYP